MSRIEVPHEFVDGKCRWCGTDKHELQGRIDAAVNAYVDIAWPATGMHEMTRGASEISERLIWCHAPRVSNILLNQVFYAGEGIDQP
jgi:hypothetical protein